LELEGLIEEKKNSDPSLRAIAALMEVKNIGLDSVTYAIVERYTKWLGATTQILASGYNICCQPWFWGAYSAENAFRYLNTDKVPGNYLVRWDDVESRWFINYIIQDDKKALSIQNKPFESADQSVTQLMKDVLDLTSNRKIFKKPAPNRPSVLSTIEQPKNQWLTGGSSGNYAQAARGPQDYLIENEEEVDFCAHDKIAGHYNFVV